MRAANIGEALKRLAKVLGNNTIGDVHLGDLGRQAGMLISEYKRMEPNSVFFDPNYKGEYPKINLTIKDLGKMYPKANVAAKEDPKRMEEVREITAEIDKGHKAYTELWKQMVDISSIEIKEVYDKLNCHFELWEGELSSFKYIPATLDIMKPYLYESQGALICDVEEESDKKPMPPLMVIKSDGATIYGTRDLATLYARVKNYNPDEIWYVVDARQSLYFEQVFRASYKTGLVPKTTLLDHYGCGTINGKDGKPYKTRDGGVLELSALMDLVREELSKKMTDQEDKDKILDILTIATIKYADLLPFRTTDYIFDVEKFCSFEGKTGPYILYTMVRINSILKKVKTKSTTITKINSETERNIYIKLSELSRVLNKAYNEKTTSYICEYLFDLCSLFNKFYGETNVLNESDKEKKSSYIAMLNLMYNTCKSLVDILAIEVPDKM
jgi:arginyl-tRNA synthetase